MYSNAKDDNHLSIIFSQNFPRKPQRINILINYENSEYRGLGTFAFVIDQPTAETIYDLIKNQSLFEIKFPTYLDRLLFQNLANSLSLAFVTYFRPFNTDQEIAIAFTSVSLDGDISQQLIEDCLHNQTYQKVARSHTWLVRQSLTVFSTKVNRYLQNIDLILLSVGGFASSFSSFSQQTIARPWQISFMILIISLIILLIWIQKRSLVKPPPEVTQAIFVSGLIIPYAHLGEISKSLLTAIILLISLSVWWLKKRHFLGLSQSFFRSLQTINIANKLPKISPELEIILEVSGIIFLGFNIIWSYRISEWGKPTSIIIQILLLTFMLLRLRDRLPSLITQWFWRKILKG
jgi:flagellar biogenesis protein FliO